jgi:hypothetical protein
MTVEIIEILNGFENSKIIKNFGDDGVQGRPYIQSYFKKDNHYIINLIKSDVKWGVHGETNDDFFVSNRSENWLNFNVETNQVYGRVNKNRFKANKKNFDFADIKKKIKQQSNL